MGFLPAVVLILFCLAGIFAVFLSFPGPAIIFAGALIFSFMTHFEILSKFVLWGLGAAAVFAELADYGLTALGIKHGGGSKAAMFGAVFGGFLGSIAGTLAFGIGIIPGTLLGIFLGAFAADFMSGRELTLSLRAGLGALLGAGGSLFLKLIIALMMTGFIAAKVIHNLF